MASGLRADDNAIRDPNPRPWQRPRVRIWGLIAIIHAVALTLWMAVVARLHHHGTIPWWALALVVTACELVPVHLEVRGEAHSVTLTEIPLVVGLLLGSPAGLVLSQIVGVNLARMLFRRQSAIKHAFNTGVSALDVTLSVVLFGLVARGLGFGPALW